MPKPNSQGEAVAPLDDQTFRSGFERMCQTQGAFVLAAAFEHSDLVRCAGEVLLYTQRRFISVAELFEQCAAHGWNSTIYEAWAYVTRQHVLDTARTLGPVASQALLAFAHSQDVMQADREEAIEAVAEAHEALYGYRTAVWL